ncbi:MAG: hypothetical protein EP343_07805 [Deltaproteobacteria bacterium]|nr:MAG: hypothetical protein EP343_07805 [Deltaproteobacteria bacterium]
MKLSKLIKSWYSKVWTEWDVELNDIAHEDVVVKGAFGQTTEGFDSFWAYQGQIWGGFPDLKAEESNLSVEGDTATCSVTWTGTHLGHIWQREGTHQPVEFHTQATLEQKDGKLCRVTETSDLAAIRTQIGATPEPPRFEHQDQQVIPAFRALDWNESRQFYGRMGFAVVFEWRHAPRFPVYAGIRCGEVNLHISEHTGDCEPGSSVSIRWPGVDALHSHITEQGLEPGPLCDQPWGDRSFNISDPSNNVLTFFEPIPTKG